MSFLERTASDAIHRNSHRAGSKVVADRQRRVVRAIEKQAPVRYAYLPKLRLGVGLVVSRQEYAVVPNPALRKRLAEAMLAVSSDPKQSSPDPYSGPTEPGPLARALAIAQKRPRHRSGG